jgi:hypothetical protein
MGSARRCVRGRNRNARLAVGPVGEKWTCPQLWIGVTPRDPGLSCRMSICQMRLGSDLPASDYGGVHQHARLTIRQPLATGIGHPRWGSRTTFAACSPATIALSRSSQVLSAWTLRSSMSLRT